MCRRSWKIKPREKPTIGQKNLIRGTINKMEERMKLKPSVFYLLVVIPVMDVLFFHQPVSAQSYSATLTINAAVTESSFIPLQVFGNNVAYWVDKADNLKIQPKLEAAGNYFLRYPGGSASDDYHWNGSGKFDSHKHWVPSDTQYTPGFEGVEIYRGTGSS